MTFSDLVKNDLLGEFSYVDVNIRSVLMTLVVTALISAFIFVVYKITTRKGFYSKAFNISLVAMALITAAIIVAIQSNLVISLGMVGALSIVRFRTAIKNPMDLVFLYWAIGTGIVCGAGLYGIAIVLSLILTICIFVLDVLPVSAAPMILVVNCKSNDCEEEITDVVKKYGHFKVKSRNITNKKLDMVVELRCKNESKLVNELSELETVENISLLSHDGEVTA